MVAAISKTINLHGQDGVSQWIKKNTFTVRCRATNFVQTCLGAQQIVLHVVIWMSQHAEMTTDTTGVLKFVFGIPFPSFPSISS